MRATGCRAEEADPSCRTGAGYNCRLINAAVEIETIDFQGYRVGKGCEGKQQLGIVAFKAAQLKASRGSVLLPKSNASAKVGRFL